MFKSKINRQLDPRDEIIEFPIEFPIPELNQKLQWNVKDKQSKKGQIKNEQLEIFKVNVTDWLVDVCENVSSVGFNHLRKDNFSEGEVKCYTAKNMLSNIKRFCEACNSFSHQNRIQLMKFIDQSILNTIEEISPKYPQTNSKGASNKTRKNIQKIDNRLSDQYDFLFKHKIVFRYKPDGDYSQEILNTVNRLISKASESVPSNDGSQRMTYNEEFKLFNQKLMNISSIQIDHKKNQSFKLFNLFSKEQENQPNQYDQYDKITDYLANSSIQYDGKSNHALKIGQKIPAHIKKLEERDIQIGKFKLNHSSVLRILTKWSQQLEEVFENYHQKIKNKTKYFKTHNNQLVFLSLEERKQLSTFIEKKRIIVQEEKKKLKQFNTILQSQFAHQIYEGKHVKKEVGVGVFSAKLQQISSQYIFKFTNFLIHTILQTTHFLQRDYLNEYQNNLRIQKAQKAKKREAVQKLQTNEVEKGFFSSILPNLFKKNNQQSSKLKEKKKQNVLEKQENEQTQNVNLQNENENSVQAKGFFPILSEINLITFKVGDILRSKYHCNQNQFNKILKCLYALDQKHPQVFKFVRIKNRLDTNNNDILINYLFDNMIVCELQLSISTDQNPKETKYNIMCHFLYEIVRSLFGSISQMACIVSQYDPIVQVYCKKTKFCPELKTTAAAQRQQMRNPDSDVSYPFICEQCKDLKQVFNFKFYISLRKQKEKICNECAFKRLMNKTKNPQATVEEIQLYQKFLKPQNDEKHNQRISTSKSIVGVYDQNFEKIKALGIKIWDHNEKLKKFDKISQQQYGQSEYSKSLEHKLFDKMLRFGFYVQKNKKTAILRCFKTVLNEIDNKIILFDITNQKKSSEGEKNLKNKFKKAFLNLDVKKQKQKYNFFKKLDAYIFFSVADEARWKQEFDTQKQSHQLSMVKIKAEQKFIKKVIDQENLNYAKLNLQNNTGVLYLSGRDHSLSLLSQAYEKQAKKYQNLVSKIKFLQVEKCKIKGTHIITDIMTEDTRQRVPQDFSIDDKPIENGIQCIKKFKNLIGLNLSHNKIENKDILPLGQTLFNLKSSLNLIDFRPQQETLERLDLSNNLINEIKGINVLLQLTQIDLSKNKIGRIRDGLKNLKAVKTLNISNNRISKIQGLQDLIFLKQLDLSKNKIVDIQGLSSQNQLEDLDLSFNYILQFKNFYTCKNLRKLYLNQNSISSITIVDEKDRVELKYRFDNLVSRQPQRQNYKQRFERLIEKMQQVSQIKFLDAQIKKLYSQVPGKKQQKQSIRKKFIEISSKILSKIKYMKNIRSLELIKLQNNPLDKIQYEQGTKEIKKVWPNVQFDKYYKSKEKVYTIKNVMGQIYGFDQSKSIVAQRPKHNENGILVEANASEAPIKKMQLKQI